MRPPLLAVALLATLSLAPGRAAAQLRVVAYNVSDDSGGGPRPGMSSVLSAIGAENRNGVARPIDVLLLGESAGANVTGTSYAALMNTLYGANTYAHGTVTGQGSGGTQSVVYRVSTVQLVGEVAVGAFNTTTGAARQSLQYTFRPIGYDGSGTSQATGTADFTIYDSHFKASTGTDGNATTSNAQRRAAEATALRATADALPVAAGASRRVVYAGDLNLYTTTEAAYAALLASGAAQATDPLLPAGGDWTGSANKLLHTQSPATTSAYGGQVLGGMNDRFDFQLVSAPLAAGQRGLSVLPGSAHAFGNNGTHTYSGAITTGSGAAPAILTDLASVSDHLPIVTDYQLPARLAVSSVSAPPRALRGSAVSATFTVTNSAPVAASVGADKLDYSYAGANGLSGGGSATGLAALAAGNAHALPVATTTPQVLSGTLSVSATAAAARGVGTPTFTQAVSVTVLDNARPSFDPATPVTATSAAVGGTPQGQNLSRNYPLYNLPSGYGAALTSNLRILGVAEAHPGGAITVTMTDTSDLAAGSSRGFTANLYSTTPGDYSDTVTFTLADENLPGSASYTLTFDVAGTVTPVPEPLGLLAAGAVIFLAGGPRQRAVPSRVLRLVRGR